MKTFVFDVTRRVTVHIDETKFTTELMEEFNASMCDYGTDEFAYQEHAELIARLAALGIEEFKPRDFVEGYGIVADAGIKVIAPDIGEYVELIKEGVTA